ncbi:MAG TPA: hypothetical protein VL172_01115, partial [Kofleriaceae bacterium]|nr:hypothetical protein [Kofleriaceae bacterium]
RGALLLGLLAACGAGADAPAADPPPPAAAPAATACPGPQVGPRQPWRHGSSRAVSTLAGDAAHAADDAIVNPGSSASIEGKFAYGTVSKDLEGEDVTLWLQVRCGVWKPITSARTDGDGRARFTVDASHIPAVGAYAFELVVLGDGTRAQGHIYVAPRGTPAVLFDVDGTLTTGDGQLIVEVLGGDANLRPGAVDVVRKHVAAGALPIYMTGRSYNLRQMTRDWLRRHGFPRGPLLTTRTIGQALPGGGRVGKFKRQQIEILRDGAGLDIRYAYGNATTDVCAYADAGLPPERTYIVGKHAGEACAGHAPTQPIGDYRDHLAVLDQLLAN